MMLKQFNPKIQPNQMPSEGQYKLLNDGNEMGVLVVMLREAVQNSWDARIRNSKNVGFSLRGINLTDKNKSALFNAIGKGEDVYGYDISQIIRSHSTALEISDCNTAGLSGPTGFDNIDGDGNKNRFIKFVHTLGNAGQTVGDGGSFGFGKTSLYKASKVGTVAIYTRTIVNGRLESRFIIKNLDKSSGKGFENSGVYWWGGEIKRSVNEDGGTWIEPIFDLEADEMWHSLGGSPFNSNDTGTKLLVFTPELSEALPGRSLMQSNLEILARNVTHYFWAKWPMESTDQGINFKISVSENGSEKEITIDHPDQKSPYNIFRSCLEIARDSNSSNDKDNLSEYYTKEIKSYQPAQSLGNLVYTVIDDRKIDLKYTSFFDSESSHIALMRNVEFVVDYFNYSVNIDFLSSGSDHEMKIIGLFRTHDDCEVYTDSSKDRLIDLNEVYRTAENQTHESWSSENAVALGTYCKTYINKTFAEIKYGLNAFVNEQREKKVDRSSEAKAQIMSFLGQFISGVQGGGQPITGSRPLTPSQTNQKIPAKPVNFEIISVDGPNQVNGTRNMVLECLLESESLQDRIKLVPVCADEEGKMTIRPDKTSSLPVRIQSVDTDQEAKIVTTEYGTAEISSNSEKLSLSVQLNLTGDCRFIIKAEK